MITAPVSDVEVSKAVKHLKPSEYVGPSSYCVVCVCYDSYFVMALILEWNYFNLAYTLEVLKLNWIYLFIP
jgi:hypothetical protein